MAGKKQSPETRDRIRAALAGKPKSLAHRAALSVAHVGLRHTAETKARMSQTRSGKPLPRVSEQLRRQWQDPEWAAKTSASIAASLVGRPLTEEHKEALRESHQGQRHQEGVVQGECVYCGDPATTEDHVTPKSRGGTDEPSNRVRACRPCNSAKGDRTPEEWALALEATVERGRIAAVRLGYIRKEER